MAASIISPDELRRHVSYDPLTGIVTRLAGVERYKGKVAGNRRPDGYWVLQVAGRNMLAHRIGWILSHGPIPVGCQIDHRDGDRSNDRLDNLRCGSHADNQHNRKQALVDSRCGLMGVRFHRQSGKWQSRITVSSKEICLGYHSTPEAAHAAYLTAKRELHPFGTL